MEKASNSGSAKMKRLKPRSPEIAWDSPSESSAGSMPLGNGDLGINVWVEGGGDLLFYIGKTDAWDENARLLKLGRIRLSLSPNPFKPGAKFLQTLKTAEGSIEIEAGSGRKKMKARIWVDAMRPVERIEIAGSIRRRRSGPGS